MSVVHNRVWAYLLSDTNQESLREHFSEFLEREMRIKMGYCAYAKRI